MNYCPYTHTHTHLNLGVCARTHKSAPGHDPSAHAAVIAKDRDRASVRRTDIDTDIDTLSLPDRGEICACSLINQIKLTPHSHTNQCNLLCCLRLPVYNPIAALHQHRRRRRWRKCWIRHPPKCSDKPKWQPCPFVTAARTATATRNGTEAGTGLGLEL